MKNLKFKIIFAAILASSTMAFCQTVVLKIATIAPANSAWDTEQKKMASEWIKLTNGKVQIKFYDVNAQGGENAVIRKMRSVRPGAPAPLDGAILTNLGAFELVPKSNILTLCVPLLFENDDEVTYVLNKVDDEMKKVFLEQGYNLMGWFCVGWAHFFTREEARTPEQMKKLRLSTGAMTSPEMGKAFELAGYNSYEVDSDQIVMKARQGELQANYTIPMYAYAARYYTELPYIMETPLCPVLASFVISDAAWKKIPAEYKPVLLESVERTKKKFIEMQKRDDKLNIKMMQDAGAKLVTLNDAERKAWESTLIHDAEAMSNHPKVKVINKEFFLKVKKLLEEYRSSKK